MSLNLTNGQVFLFNREKWYRHIESKYGYESTLRELVCDKIGAVEQLTLLAFQQHHFDLNWISNVPAESLSHLDQIII